MVFGYGTKSVFAQTAQTSQSSLYVPLIGIALVPEPLALPKGPGNVVYHYTIKNFIQELPLTNIQVIDDKCSPVQFINGDENDNSRLDYGEVWRYTCTTELSKTTYSTATAIGITNDITATHKAYALVVVGTDTPPPLVSIVNITKIAYPLYLPAEGGKITFTYKVTNPGVVSLSDVTVIDDKCNSMSDKLGDINGNNLLDVAEVWIYTCTMDLKQTTTNKVVVTASANGLKTSDNASLTVKVESPTFPDLGENPNLNSNLKIIVWKILSGVLAILIVFLFLTQKSKHKSVRKK